MGKVCSICGQPLVDHLPADEPLALEPRRHAAANLTRRNARLARVAASSRICPVVPVTRTRGDGSEYAAWVPRWRAEADATATPPLPDLTSEVT
jgi:hypothetical protein